MNISQEEDKTDLRNYMGIILLKTVVKASFKRLKNQIPSVVEKNGTTGERQGGF